MPLRLSFPSPFPHLLVLARTVHSSPNSQTRNVVYTTFYEMTPQLVSRTSMVAYAQFQNS